MKKLILFFISVFLLNNAYSQYKIRINWNRPKPQSVSQVQPKKQPVIENKVVDSTEKIVISEPEIPKKEIIETEDKLKKFIDSWMGVKYVFGGDSRKGIDCSAFVRRLYKSVYNVSLPRTCVYQYQLVTKVKKECLELGDLIFFRTKRGGSGWHVGVFLGNDKFVHASGKGRNVMISNLNDSFYKRIYLNGGRL
jgi:cell wall-associated NlpC family hydrolase